tara:strand:- start:196 stop:672 length:477 start_codon:yes stop_codon:yes gene_type:complete
MAQLLSGWGRAGFGELAFGEGTIPVTLTAPGAATAGSPVAGVNAQAIASVPGVSASVGSLAVLVDGEANVSPSGVSATSAIGSISLVTNNNLSINGFVLQGDSGIVTTEAKAGVTIIEGLESTGSLGKVLVWSVVDESQTPNYTNTTNTQTPNWENVA